MKDRYALFGDPVAHSRSPTIYAAFAEVLGRRFEFELVQCPAGDFVDAVRRFGREGGRGANVTLPHKAAALTAADSASTRSRLAGVANLLRFETDGLLFADNTDGVGLAADLTRNLGLDLTGKRILVVGAGGAAAGIIGPLLEHAPAELAIINRTDGKTGPLAARYAALGRVESPSFERPGADYDLVINATSASLYDDVPSLPASVFARGAIAYDLCYHDSGETAFTRWAHEAGAGAALDGWGMLVEQAAESCLSWFGRRPDTKNLLRRD